MRRKRTLVDPRTAQALKRLEVDARRRQMLERNAELRKDRHNARALPDHSGHIAFALPEADYWYWTFVYPDLACPDPIIARRAWEKFLNTDEGRGYKLNPHEGKRIPVHRILVR